MARRSVLATAAFTAAAAFLAGCGGSDPSPAGNSAPRAESRSLDLGGVTVRTQGDSLRIAMFLAGTSNSFLQNNISAAKTEAERVGAKVDVFDGKFDPSVQFNQMQTALGNKRYNAWIVQANDAQQVCDITTKQAPAAGILVSAITLPLCGRNSNSGDELWAPGTLNFVGGSGTYPVIKAWMDRVVAANPGRRRSRWSPAPTSTP
jgi:ribose transport system substrate-binding protein